MKSDEQLTENNINPWVNKVMRQDLQFLMEKREQPLDLISNESGVPVGVLKQILGGNSLVADSTIYRFYTHFLEHAGVDFTSIRHEWIKSKYLKNKKEQDGVLNQKIESMIAASKTLQDIYLMTRLHPISREQVNQQYGDEGVFGLELLEQAEVIKKENDFYVAGETAISKSPQLLKILMEQLLATGLREQYLWNLEENSCFYGMEMVDEETYLEVLQILDETKLKVKNCLQKSSETKGTIPLFMIGAVDKYYGTLVGDKH